MSRSRAVLTGIVFAAIASAVFAMTAGATGGSVVVTPAAPAWLPATDAGGGYTTLSTVALAETDAATIGAGSVVIHAPAGFEMAASPVTVTDRNGTSGLVISGDPDCATTGTVTVVPAADAVTFFVCAASSDPAGANLGIDGIMVRPAAPTPLAGGHVYVDATSTANLPGVTAGPDGTSLGDVAEVAGPAASLTVTGPANAMAGSTASVRVTAHDTYGNVATTYTGTVHVTSNDPQAALPPDYAFTPTDGGIHDFDVVFRTAGARFVTVDDVGPGIAGDTSGATTVAPGPAASLTVGVPADATAGGALTFVVTARDAFGNVATGYDGTVDVSSTDAQATLVADYTFTPADAGASEFTVTLRTAGPQSVTVTDVGGTVAGATGQTTVAPGPASRLSMSADSTTLAAGSSLAATVDAFDAFGNRATTYRGTIRFDATDPQATVPGDYTFTDADAGSHTFAGVVFRTAGWHVLTATDSVDATLSDVVSGIVVTPGPTVSLSLSLSGDATSAAAGLPVHATATTHDAFGNVTVDYTGALSATSGDPQALLPLPHELSSTDLGTWSFDVAFGTAGVQHLAVTDGTLVSNTIDVSVTAAPAAIVAAWVEPGAVVADGVSTATVNALVMDAYGNRRAGDRVDFTSTDDVAVGATSDNGDGTYSALVTASTTAGSGTLRAVDGSAVGAATLVEMAGPAASLSVTGIASPVVAGDHASVTVVAFDAFGNVADGFTGTLHFTSSDTLATLPADYTFTAGDAGVHTFTDDVTLVTLGLQSVRATDVANAGVTGSQDGIKVVMNTLLTLLTTGSTVDLAPVHLDGRDRYADGQLHAVEVLDNRTTAVGWSVTATMTDLATDGGADPPNHRIPARNLSWDPRANGGCHAFDGDGDGVVDGTNDGITTGPGGLAGTAGAVFLDPQSPASLCSAATGSGVGAFTVQPTLRLHVPASAAAGTYTGVLTITVS